MKVFGFVNIIRGGGGPVQSKGGGPLGLVVVVVLLVLGVAAYRSADASLRGLQESAHEANVAFAWCLGGILLVAAVVAGAWLLLGRRREVKQRPQVEALQAQIAASRRAQALDLARRPAVEAPRPTRVEAVRLDALERH